MIKANELRIGNKVLCTANKGYGGPGITTVNSIARGINYWQDMGASGEIPFKDIEGIPLTEEWLERMGFENVRSGTYGIGCFEIWVQGKQLFYSESLPNSPEIKFVHQLQNLYFALCGEELTIKQMA